MQTQRLQRHQYAVLELSRYEYLLDCVTLIESAVRNQNNLNFADARGRLSDALELFPTGELVRRHELLSTHLNMAGKLHD